VQVDVFGGPLLLDDVVVLCTDGLTRYIAEAEIMEAVCAMRPQQAVDQLVRMANERGGKDNVTVLVLQVVEPDDDLDTEPGLRPVEAPDALDLEDLEQTLATRRETPPSRRVWPFSPLAAVGAALAVGLGALLLVIGALRGGASGISTAEPRVMATQERAVGPTQTPGLIFEAGTAVRFVVASSLYESPGMSASEVYAAIEGEDAQVLGGPTWNESGAVWWLLKLTPPGGQPVTGWAMQAVLDRIP
jgi:hypothetical protein